MAKADTDGLGAISDIEDRLLGRLRCPGYQKPHGAQYFDAT